MKVWASLILVVTIVACGGEKFATRQDVRNLKNEIHGNGVSEQSLCLVSPLSIMGEKSYSSSLDHTYSNSWKKDVPETGNVVYLYGDIHGFKMYTKIDSSFSAKSGDFEAVDEARRKCEAKVAEAGTDSMLSAIWNENTKVCQIVESLYRVGVESCNKVNLTQNTYYHVVFHNIESEFDLATGACYRPCN